MAYGSVSQMRAELESIVIGYVWEVKADLAPPEMQAKNPTLKMLARIRQFAPFTPAQAKTYKLEVIAEYCWLAYQKSFTAAGDMVIGRQKHLGWQGLYEKVAELVKEGTPVDPKKPGTPNLTFLDEGTRGNLLNQDKWAGPINDAWVLGGIHRKAKFRLASPRLMENLWDKDGRFVVTAREILGLLCFGYELNQIGPWQVFLPRKDGEHKATTATLTQYSNYINANSSIKTAENLEALKAKGPRGRTL